MGLNARQIVKIVLGIVMTLYILFGADTVAPPYKAVMIAITWLAVAAAVWLRRSRV